MAIIVKETTVWDDMNSDRMNHYYALTDDRRSVIGYLKADGSEYKCSQSRSILILATAHSKSFKR